MSIWPEPIALAGDFARLEPLDHSHGADLAQASMDGELWRLWYTQVPHPDLMEAEIDRRLGMQAVGLMVPFAICLPGGQAVGMTSFCNLAPDDMRLEIGHTWLRRAAQGSAINMQAKLLMLAHAFEAHQCNAVELRTHAMNQQSRAAIERLGAKLDGILRAHRIMADGSLRDTAVYSILAHEWPAVRSGLRARLEPFGK